MLPSSTGFTMTFAHDSSSCFNCMNYIKFYTEVRTGRLRSIDENGNESNKAPMFGIITYLKKQAEFLGSCRPAPRSRKRSKLSFLNGFSRRHDKWTPLATSEKLKETKLEIPSIKNECHTYIYHDCGDELKSHHIQKLKVSTEVTKTRKENCSKITQSPQTKETSKTAETNKIRKAKHKTDNKKNNIRKNRSTRKNKRKTISNRKVKRKIRLQPPTPSLKVKKDEGKKVPGKGTLKRKRLYLEIMKNNDNYEDDIFEQRDLCKLQNFDEEELKAIDIHNLPTPTWSISLSPREGSESPTYEDCYSPTELSASRKEAEEYQFRRIKRRKSMVLVKNESPQPAHQNAKKANTSELLKKVRQIMMKLPKKEQECDNENDEDYYFSDVSDKEEDV